MAESTNLATIFLLDKSYFRVQRQHFRGYFFVKKISAHFIFVIDPVSANHCLVFFYSCSFFCTLYLMILLDKCQMKSFKNIKIVIRVKLVCLKKSLFWKKLLFEKKLCFQKKIWKLFFEKTVIWNKNFFGEKKLFIEKKFFLKENFLEKTLFFWKAIFRKIFKKIFSPLVPN